MNVKTKICGLRRAEDARHAATAGADFLGVVLDHGPRQASEDEIRAVVAAAQGIPVLAVVVHSLVADVLRRRDRTGFVGVQLHGGQADHEALAYRREGLLVWRTARVTAESDTPDPRDLTQHADAVLAEPWVRNRAGASGTALEPSLAVRIRQQLAPVRMVLAGGLTPSNVAAFAELVQPYAVDVSSGVEHAPGVKDQALVTRFLEVIRGISARG